jgi:4-methyl-5(b-hydroxyethyl)-thiazole monophosphate biosynthesis
MKLMIPLADGFDEMEAFTILYILRKAGVNIETVGITGSQVSSSSGVKVSTDKRLIDIGAEEYEGVIVPGGIPAFINLSRTAKFIEILKRLDEKGKLIAAISTGPAVLAKAGLLDKRKATIYPGLERELVYPRPDKIVRDMNILTCQSPADVLEFALTIVERIQGKPTVAKIKKELVM